MGASLLAQQVKNLPVMQWISCNTGVARDVGLIPGLGRFPWRRKWQPTPGFLPGKAHGQRSLVGYGPWCCKRIGHDLVTKQQQTFWIVSLQLICNGQFYVPIWLSYSSQLLNQTLI